MSLFYVGFIKQCYSPNNPSICTSMCVNACVHVNCVHKATVISLH